MASLMLRAPVLPAISVQYHFRPLSARRTVVRSSTNDWISSQTRNPPLPVVQTLAFMHKTLNLTRTVAESLVQSVNNLVEQPTPSDMATIEVLRSKLSIAGTVFTPLCFAAISSGSVNTPLTVVASGMAKWLELYSGVLMVRVLLSWFPNIPWERQPLQAIRDMCDPYLNLFRNIVPPLFNALDVSPLLAFLVLGVLTSILNTTIQA